MNNQYTKVSFKSIGNEDGHLIPLEAGRNIPFDIKRVYYIYSTKPDVHRGFHAHKDLKQMLVCTSGSCKVLVDTGNSQELITLSSPTQGLLIEGLIWREMYDFSSDCVLMVLADDYYKEADYIRDYETFKQEVSHGKN